MTTVIFVRHGESESNWFLHQDKTDPELSKKINALGDPKLTGLGSKQADKVGEYLHRLLKGKNLRIFTSPFQRTSETAEPFISRKVKEKIAFSIQTLGVLQEYTKPQKHLTQDHHNKGIVHHETWDDFTKQIRAFVDELEDHCQENDHPIVIFGHSLYLSVLVSYIASSKEMMPKKEQLVFRFPNCSITTFEYSQSSWRIFNVGSLAHLKKGLITGTECPFGNTLQ
jgi:broad specificity phosphatase PhoE